MLRRMPKESSITSRVVARFEKHRFAFAIKLHGFIFQRVGLPDLLLLWRAGFEPCGAPCVAFVEVKQPGKNPTALQQHLLNRLRNVGLPVSVLRDPSELDDVLEAAEQHWRSGYVLGQAPDRRREGMSAGSGTRSRED